MKTLIVGGGLSGLALADMLHTAGMDYHLLEARDRFGGRIVTEQHGDGSFDLGPAWFWPGQPRISALIRRFGLSKFEQFASGDLVFEDEMGRVRQVPTSTSMAGSWRLAGGLGALIEALASKIPAGQRQLNAMVTELRMDTSCKATLSDGSTIKADQVVLAMPPRLMAQIAFAPALPAHSIEAMEAIPTWMAGQAKAVAIYDTSFWRDKGLSGAAMSRHGPMVEIHDASPETGGPFALFGFIGVPPHARSDADALRASVLEQLTRLFGSQAAEPRALILKDWSSDPFTATEADKAPLYGHPRYGMPQALQELWEGRLKVAGTEVAADFGGYLEGALEAADHVLRQLVGNAAETEHHI